MTVECSFAETREYSIHFPFVCCVKTPINNQLTIIFVIENVDSLRNEIMAHHQVKIQSPPPEVASRFTLKQNLGPDLKLSHQVPDLQHGRVANGVQVYTRVIFIQYYSTATVVDQDSPIRSPLSSTHPTILCLPPASLISASALSRAVALPSELEPTTSHCSETCGRASSRKRTLHILGRNRSSPSQQCL